MRQIRIYIHCTIINHWRDICAELTTHLTESGLLSSTESINLGFVNDSTESREECLALAPKGSVIRTSENRLDQYEFPTIGVLQKDCRKAEEPFFCLYVHFKGSFNMAESQEVWRRAMIRFCIDSWQECVEKLELGYATAGAIGATENIGKVYHSGNYWWARSEYIASLPAIGTFDQSNRYWAEQFATYNHEAQHYFHKLNQRW